MDCGRTAGLAVMAAREPSSVVWGMWENEIQASTPKSAGADSPPPAGDKCSEAHIFQPVQPRSARLVQSQISDESPHAWSSNAGSGQKANGEAVGLPAAVYLPIDRNTIPWNGVPANVPEWAERLYADTPEPERPTGWRALLIYSGGIFKFDLPETLDEPNGIPTAEPMQWALLAGDRAYAFPPDNTEDGTLAAPNPSAPTTPASPPSPAISHGPNPWFDTYTFPPSWREHRNALRHWIPRTPPLARSAGDPSRHGHRTRWPRCWRACSPLGGTSV